MGARLDEAEIVQLLDDARAAGYRTDRDEDGTAYAYRAGEGASGVEAGVVIRSDRMAFDMTKYPGTPPPLDGVAAARAALGL